MNTKNILILAVIFIGQTILSCGPCNCGDPETVEITYESIEIEVYDISGFNPAQVTGQIKAGDFGLQVFLPFTDEPVAMKTGFGFSSAFACDCIGPDYIFEDPIQSMKVVSIDATNDVESDVSEFVSVESSTTGALQEYFPTEDEYEWYHIYNLTFSDEYNAPQQVVFRIEVELQSGITFSTETAEFEVI